MWFIAGTPGTPAERSCTIPADKAILVAIVNGAFWIPTDGDTPEVIRAVANAGLDNVNEVEATLDGVPFQGLRNFRFRSDDTFFFTGPPEGEETVFPGSNGTHEAYADGFYIMLEPLTPGNHTLTFRGKVVFPATFPNTQVFEVGPVVWNLTIQ